MPFLFLSPSTQEFNPYITSGNEEYWMNRIADEMEPYLRASGINVTRNDPSQPVSAAIRLSNAGNYGLHLALHSNAAPAALSGRLRGVDIYYYPGKAAAQRAAELLRETLEVVYPLPEEVRTVTTTSLAEVRSVRAPAVLAELGYHDNTEDAAWIGTENAEIARALSLAVAEFFELPFLSPAAEYAGIAAQESGNLNLRGGPGVRYPILGKIPRGGRVQVVNRYGDWYVVSYGGTLGYASANYIRKA